MAERLLILAIVILAVLALWGGISLWRRNKLHLLRNETPLSKLIPNGKPAIVAFSSPSCRDCYTLQAPALARLKSKLHDHVTITSLSALDHPDLVDYLGILTVPSTIVVDARGAVKALNLGYTSDVKLSEQLAQAMA